MRRSTLSPRQAADLLGVSEATVRRWCDRRLLPATRTAGRHRRIERSALLQFAHRKGITVAGRSDRTAGSGGRLAAPTELTDRLFRDLLDGDELAVRAFVVELATETMEPAAVCDQVIAPAMTRIGKAWQQGTLDVHQEHVATNALQAALNDARLYSPAVPAAAPVAICASLTGDPYSLGPMMSALVLHTEGYRTRLVGIDTPAGEIHKAARSTNASLAAVSIGCVPDDDALVRDLRALSTEASRMGLRLAVGGRGLSRSLRTQMKADFFGDTMGHLANYARHHFPTLRRPLTKSH
jgi:excisionase family DNA binding protein